MGPAVFSCFAPTHDFSQPSSRCAVSQRSPWPALVFLRDDMFWDERGGGLTRQPVGLFGDTSTMTTAMNTNRVDPGREASLTMLCIPVYTLEERRPYSATLYPTRFTLALTIRAQRKTHGWCFTSGSRACGGFFV